ncbi:hypothetical protein FB446DRAFT_654216 [Lentinula raphanica]|nr:hypothetical protein FB446DRAFT_654216 [Lentinula raphanica]
MGLTCLNLPLQMKNDPAYTYIPGIIQGPHEPPATEAAHRHYLRPLVAELEAGYTRGIAPYGTFKTHGLGDATPSYQRVFRVALAGVLMDFKAARPFAGLLDVTSHHFCFKCRCWHKAHLGRTDFEQWDSADDEFLKRGAELWREAQVHERSAIEECYGTRFTELWQLPYWKPSQQLLVDPMHTIYLIAQQTFFRNALKLENPDSKEMKQKTKSSLIAYHFNFTPPPPFISSEPTLNRHSAYAVGHIHRILTQALQNDEEGEKTLRKALDRRSQAALLYVCIDVERVPFGTVHKVDLIEALVSWRKTKPQKVLETAFVNSSELLKRLHCTIQNTTIPTWISKPPSQVGLPDQGTLKADHWRTLFAVHLPLAELSLWIKTSPISSEDPTDMASVLETSMSLTCASLTIVKNRLTPERREFFRQAFRKHIMGLKKNFPGFLLPSHHLAFHIHDFMETFSNVRYWWCFPFERLIGKLQRIGTNHKIGMFEYTLLHSFIKGASFRQWLLRSDCPPLLQYCGELLDKAYGYNTQTTSFDGDDAYDPSDQDTVNLDELGKTGSSRHIISTPPTSELIRLTGTDDIQCFSRIAAPNGNYAIAPSVGKAGVGNSYICYEIPGTHREVDWSAGQIQHIFRQDGRMYMAIKRSKKIPLTTADPFRSFWKDGFCAKMVSLAFSKNLEIVEVDRVIAHTARWELTADHAVVLNLSRVGLFFFI